MTDGGPPLAKPAAFWGSILSSARVHATTAEVWQAIRDASDSAGVALPPGMFAEVNRMRSLATALRNSGEAIGRAGMGDAITSAMIGRQLYARSPTEQALSPAFHVRFELQTIAEGTTYTSWYTLEYQGALPATIGDLYADVGAYADTLAGDYGVTAGEVGSIEIGAF